MSNTSRWGGVHINLLGALTIDIDAYYDAGEDKWKPIVTAANSSYNIWWNNPLQEASDEIATAANCTQMISDLDIGSRGLNGVPTTWYMLESVMEHEKAHVNQWKGILQPKFNKMKESIEGLSVEHACGKTKDEAKNELKELGAYKKAFLTARNTAHILFGLVPDKNPQTFAAEKMVLDKMIKKIKKKGDENLDWPAACKNP